MRLSNTNRVCGFSHTKQMGVTAVRQMKSTIEFQQLNTCNNTEKHVTKNAHTDERKRRSTTMNWGLVAMLGGTEALTVEGLGLFVVIFTTGELNEAA